MFNINSRLLSAVFLSMVLSACGVTGTENGLNDVKSPTVANTNKPGESSPDKEQLGTLKDIEVPESKTALHQRSYFALYMVGGDLEDDSQPRNGKADEAETGTESPYGSGSSDLRELVRGYGSLSTEQKSKLDILVAFGGARKKGWQGIKYADMACLAKDAEDDYFGNADCYLKRDDSANMGAENTFTDFLTFYQQKSQTHRKKVLNLWDHGVAYLGIGIDTNHDGDLILLTEMKNALEKSKLQVDLMGFDACLMASLEVAQQVKDHARYMVASEELEPGHGWNYTDYITHMGTQSEASVEALGRHLVDSYIDHPTHQKRRNKTLSLVDLKEIDPLVEATDNLISQLSLNDFQGLLRGLTATQHYGSKSKGDVIFSNDLLHLMQNLEKEKQLSGVDALASKFKAAVVYNRHDASKVNSNGLSVYSLDKTLKPAYGSNLSFSPTWLNFAEQFVTKGSNDNQRPTLKPRNDFGVKQEGSFLAECQVDGEQGHCFEAQDDVGLYEVNAVYGIELKDGRIIEMGNDEMDSLDAAYSQFAIESWDRYWLQMCSGPCANTEERAFVALYYDDFSKNGKNYIYSGEVNYNGEKALLYIELSLVDEATKTWKVLDEWVVPYEEKSDQVVFSRQQYKLKAGDQLDFYFDVYDPRTSQTTSEVLKRVTLNATPEWEYFGLRDKLRYYIEAIDYNGNKATSTLFELPQIRKGSDDDDTDFEEFQ